MKCAWKELLDVIPLRLRREVDRLGRESGQELRLRLGKPPQLVRGREISELSGAVSREELEYVIHNASRYSPWAAAGFSRGYITAPGGHRVGICGEAVMRDGVCQGIRNPTSLCIRIARDFPGISADLEQESGSVLILGAPGWGKTTLLRDLIRRISDSGHQIAVVDEREELFPVGFDRGACTDVLTGISKPVGLDMLMRVMGPELLAVDEITAYEDCEALRQAAGCGVRLLATAHGSSMEDFLSRPVYATLAEAGLFGCFVILHEDKTWHRERSMQCNTNGLVRC